MGTTNIMRVSEKSDEDVDIVVRTVVGEQRGRYREGAANWGAEGSYPRTRERLAGGLGGGNESPKPEDRHWRDDYTLARDSQCEATTAE